MDLPPVGVSVYLEWSEDNSSGIGIDAAWIREEGLVSMLPGSEKRGWYRCCLDQRRGVGIDAAWIREEGLVSMLPGSEKRGWY